jgi:hypothetical protein
MPRNRTPNSVAKITGDTLKHPERHKGRSDPPTSPIGAAPKRLDDKQRAAWGVFVADMPWLVSSDRSVVELASRLIVMIGEPDCPIGVFAQLRLCLSSMGGTPADRSRVQWGDDSEPDPADEFLN